MLKKIYIEAAAAPSTSTAGRLYVSWLAPHQQKRPAVGMHTHLHLHPMTPTSCSFLFCILIPTSVVAAVAVLRLGHRAVGLVRGALPRTTRLVLLAVAARTKMPALQRCRQCSNWASLLSMTQAHRRLPKRCVRLCLCLYVWVCGCVGGWGCVCVCVWVGGCGCFSTSASVCLAASTL